MIDTHKKQTEKEAANSYSLASIYRALLEEYYKDTRRDEEKAKSLLYSLALYEWEKSRYMRNLLQAVSSIKEAESRAQKCIGSVPFFVPKEERPSEVGLYYKANGNTKTIGGNEDE